tara:strand:- start:235 stop:789 length:555 start_codon:yes stop_codon:yes gene_type:complete
MTVRISKPAFNLREKLTELDYSQIPYEKMPIGSIITSTIWKVPATAVNTAGSWAYSTNPTNAATYSVANFTFKKKLSHTIVQGIAVGMVDVNGANGDPTVVSLTNLHPGTAVYGAAYRHQRVQNQEPDAYVFAFTDDMSEQDDPLNPTYYLRCHSSADNMYFSRMQAGTTPNNPYRLLFQEVMV